MVFCTIIVVIMSNPFRRITLILPSTVPCYAVQQIFFFCLSKGKRQLSKLSIRTKLVVKRVFCTIIVVIMLNPTRRITLKLPSTVPWYAVQQFFFFCLSKGKRPAIKTVNSNEASCENGVLHNHCSDNVEPNSKDNSETVLHCFLLRGSTDFFFSGSPR